MSNNNYDDLYEEDGAEELQEDLDTTENDDEEDSENTEKDRKNEVIAQPAKRKTGRPRKDETRLEEALVTRENRVPVGGFRKALEVKATKALERDYHLFWEWDEDDNGRRLWNRKLAGYTHVTHDEVKNVGMASVYKTNNVGSIVRVPNGRGPGHMYLMKIPHEFYQDDRSEIEKRNVESEAMAKAANSVDGSYGSIKFGKDNF